MKKIINGVGFGICLGFLFGVGGIILCNANYSNDKNIKLINKSCDNEYDNECDNEYDKMYKIIERASELDKDPYSRKISSDVVNKFCEIAKNKSINLDTITDKEFDEIYAKYVEYTISKCEKQ
jgi:hypothetical protein